MGIDKDLHDINDLYYCVYLNTLYSKDTLKYYEDKYLAN